MGIDEYFKPPVGMFRIIGYNPFDREFFRARKPEDFYKEAVYESFQEAQITAILKQGDEDKTNGADNEIAATFHVIDDEGKIIYSTNIRPD